jgi:hypothetical protein
MSFAMESAACFAAARSWAESPSFSMAVAAVRAAATKPVVAAAACFALVRRACKI